MARLNEPPALVDSFDNLRRKFLRQNRDIARVNSNQSLRIRGLENECARLLSENLDLRGQVLRLEKELEDDKSQRAAQHALQIKQKMEAQLIELGSLIAGFGLEPPTKRLSPVASRRADRPPRSSLPSQTMSPQQRKPPALSPGEAESLAIQEGRLPPIYETKTFPRQTLSREEIIALQSDDIEAAGSPELGPPPVSRLLRDDSAKPAETVNKSTDNLIHESVSAAETKGEVAPKEQPKERVAQEADTTKASQPAPSSTSTKQKPDAEKKVAVLRIQGANAKATDPVLASESSAATSSIAPSSVTSTPTSKPGAKRKFAVNDENAVLRGMKAGNGNGKAVAPVSKGLADNSASIRELKNPRSIRNLVNSRKDSNESHSEIKTAVGGRRPLAAKSTNEDISSPRKQAQAGNTGKSKANNNNNNNNKPNANADKAAPLGGRMRSRMKMPLAVDIPDVPPPIIVNIDIDDDKTDDKTREPTTPTTPTTPLMLDDQEPAHLVVDNKLLPETEGDIVCPHTPPPPTATILASQRLMSAQSEGRDTPPPADISSQGETSRPNRRSRASVSYAEPNLRDKMRRPTKELFDAVAGEGKYVQRQSLQVQQPSQGQDQDGQEQVAAAALTKAETPSSTIKHQQPKEERDEASQHSSDSDNRKPRASSAAMRDRDQKPSDGSALGAENGSCHAVDQDPYEFTVSSSPASQETEDEESEASSGKGRGARSSTKKSASNNNTHTRASLKITRRSSTATVREDGSSTADRHTRPSAARKRTSMVALKRGSMAEDDEDDAADSSYEPPAAESNEIQDVEGRALSTRDRISRRRSMML